MKLAVIKSPGGDDITNGAHVVNVVVAPENMNRDIFLQSLGLPTLDASELGLEIGDMLVDGHWTRNINGEQVILPIEEDSADVKWILDQIFGSDTETEEETA